jgi:ubiquitin C-terminal hydrolase
MSSNELIYKVSKYKNIMGITCYMNSILHILQQLPYFTSYIYNKMFEYNLNKQNDHKKTLIYELYKLFQMSLNNDDVVIVPYAFKKSIGIKNNIWNELNQQDSQEFLVFLLSHLQEEIGKNYEILYGNHNFILNYDDNNISNIPDIQSIIACYAEIKYKSKEYSILSQLFDGLIEITNSCMCCNAKSYMYESFLTLSLSIPHSNILTIYDCFDEFIKQEQLDENNMFNCDFCGLKNRSYKKTLFWRTPKILILHLKRFSQYDILTDTLSQKLTNNIEYPIKNLNLSNYFHKNSPYKNNCLYDLIGINIHKSLGNQTDINNGHYVSIIKNMFNNNWYLYNDEYAVKQINDIKYLQHQDAYLLFYCNISN